MAGALHQAGISFGRPDDLMGPDRRFNPKGHFEMHSWWAADNALAQQIQMCHAGLCGHHIDLIARRNAEQPVIWGVKSPFLPWTLPVLLQHLPKDLRIVVMHRRFDAIVASKMRHGNAGTGLAYQAAVHDTACDLSRMYSTCVTASYLPQYHAQFEEIIANPKSEMAALMDFCLDGIEYPAALQSAIDWIEPRLVHA